MVAIIFDMDGVIVDSEKYWGDTSQQILAETVDGDDIAFSDIQGMNVQDQYDYLAKNYSVSISRDEYIERYDDEADTVYTDQADLLPGLRDMLSVLHADGIPVAIASSSFRHWIQLVLDRFNLADDFNAVVSAEDIDGRSKPAPDIYLYAAEQVGADPGECVVIEDSAHGVTAAKNAGMHCVGFRTEVNQEQDLSHADRVLDGSEELQEFFAQHQYRTLIEQP